MKPTLLLFTAVFMWSSTSFAQKQNGPAVSQSSLIPDFEKMPVYRLQLRLTTGRKKDAGTDHPVFVQMNNKKDSFYLVKGIDNFQEGKTETYDVLLRSVKKVKDIDYIRFSVNGDDGVCLKKIELLLNNNDNPVFSVSYNGEQGACFDKGTAVSSLYISGNDLRNSAQWNAAGPRAGMWQPPKKISKAWITSLVEAAIGHQVYMEGGDIKWGTAGNIVENQTLWGPAVEISRVNAHTLHVDLDLEVDRSGPNPELDVDFDMIFICEKSNIKVEVINAAIETDALGKVLNFISYGPRIGAFILNGIGSVRRAVIKTPDAVEGLSNLPEGLLGLLADNLKFDVNLDVTNQQVSGSCSTIDIQSNGDIIIN